MKQYAITNAVFGLRKRGLHKCLFFFFYFKLFIRKIFISSLKLQWLPQGFEGLNNIFEMAYLLVIKGVYANFYVCTHTLTYINYCMSSTSSLISYMCVSVHEHKHICMYFTLFKGELCSFNCLDWNPGRKDMFFIGGMSSWTCGVCVLALECKY